MQCNGLLLFMTHSTSQINVAGKNVVMTVTTPSRQCISLLKAHAGCSVLCHFQQMQLTLTVMPNAAQVTHICCDGSTGYFLCSMM